VATRKYNSYTIDQLKEAVSTSFSIAQVLRLLDLAPVGGNYSTMRVKIAKHSIDTSHFTGMLWNKNKSLKDYSEYKRNGNLKNKLIKQEGHICMNCQNAKWQSLPIPLELHHINGNSTDNSRENLQLLCPNCHFQTPNFRGRNI